MPSYLSIEERSIVTPPSVPVHSVEHTPQISLVQKRAVIVEDEGITQLQLRKILRSKGIQVVGTAANGKEAIEVVLRERPDLVLMDIKMPVMDGLEASRHILAKGRFCIVILTAFSEESFRQRADELGACGYVLKPISADTLMPELEAAYRKFHHPESFRP
jgi:two-component system, response regulator PdtaR